MPRTKSVEKLTEKSEADAARELVRMAKEQGFALTGPDGLLKQLTKTVIETALDEELTEHLGYERHDTAAKGTANSRDGTRLNPGQSYRPAGREELPGSFEPKLIEPAERSQVGRQEVAGRIEVFRIGSEGTSIIGRPRPLDGQRRGPC